MQPHCQMRTPQGEQDKVNVDTMVGFKRYGVLRFPGGAFITAEYVSPISE